MRPTLPRFLLLPFLLACAPAKDGDTAADPATPRPPGDPEAGWEVLRYGDYVGAGVPADLWFEYIGESRSNRLEREGDAARLPSGYNLFETPEGALVVGGITCFGCHSSTIDGQFIPGLGGAFADFTDASVGYFELLLALAESRYGEDSPEYIACERLVRGGLAVAEHIVTPFAGVNPAFGVEFAAAAHRDPETLEWTGIPVYSTDRKLPASDVPPWWNVKKKEALYYNGMGRGDFARLIQQIGVVGIIDAEHASDIDADFADVLAWIDALQPPVWPDAVDEELAADGEALFVEHCSRCHGTYGEDESYPSLRVGLDEVGTDPAYAEALADEGFNAWLEASWYAEGDQAAEFDAELGYMAPPLDGIWATAPYLHNGSVPDLVSLLDSSQRPAAWWRNFSSSTYDHDRVGWPWSVPERDAETGAWPSGTYDTTVEGYSNSGHTFGDALTDAERAAVLAYLLTL